MTTSSSQQMSKVWSKHKGQKMQVALTGGTGFIGRYIVDHLADQGHSLRCWRTRNELSIVCCQVDVPSHVQAERDWRCLRIAGQLDFPLVGVIAQITELLATANISVFVISTYDTDYFLSRQQDLERTMETLKHAGHSIKCAS